MPKIIGTGNDSIALYGRQEYCIKFWKKHIIYNQLAIYYLLHKIGSEKIYTTQYKSQKVIIQILEKSPEEIIQANSSLISYPKYIPGKYLGIDNDFNKTEIYELEKIITQCIIENFPVNIKWYHNNKGRKGFHRINGVNIKIIDNQREQISIMVTDLYGELKRLFAYPQNTVIIKNYINSQKS